VYENELKELSIAFPPSYPFEEDMQSHATYMESRCPAWCDRIIMNSSLADLVQSGHKHVYDMMGQQTCMGDHKPVFLFYNVNNNNNSDNHLKQTSNSHTSTEPVNDLNYVYINNQLAHLDKLNTDIHDNAWFQCIDALNYSVNFPTYCEFLINSLSVPIAKQHTSRPQQHQRLNKSSEFSVKYKHDLVLNQWLQSIAELIIFKNRDHTEHKQSANCTYKTDCDCLAKQVAALAGNDSTSHVLKFFTNSLNSNFFKLKHLLFYLDETISYLTKDLKAKCLLVADMNNNMNNTNESDEGVKFSAEDLSQPFEVSVKSLMILNEVRSFLNTPCSLNFFKHTIKRTFSAKRLSIMANIFHS